MAKRSTGDDYDDVLLHRSINLLHLARVIEIYLRLFVFVKFSRCHLIVCKRVCEKESAYSYRASNRLKRVADNRNTQPRVFPLHYLPHLFVLAPRVNRTSHGARHTVRHSQRWPVVAISWYVAARESVPISFTYRVRANYFSRNISVKVCCCPTRTVGYVSTRRRIRRKDTHREHGVSRLDQVSPT